MLLADDFWDDGRIDQAAACAKRSTCTAPGAPIRTMAYVVTECITDPKGRSALGQKLLVRRGNCDPVTLLDISPPTPVPVPDPAPSLGLCRFWGESRREDYGIIAGVFQHLAVLSDGSRVVFEVRKPTWPVPSVAAEPPEEGIFIVRSDGTGRRRLGGPGLPIYYTDPEISADKSGLPTGAGFRVNPNGRSIAVIDVGPDSDGNPKPQLFLQHLYPPYKRKQLTHQTHPTGPLARTDDPGIWMVSFIDRRTLGFSTGSTVRNTLEAFQVRTDGSGFRKVPPLTIAPDTEVVSPFTIFGKHPHAITVNFPHDENSRPGFPPVREVVLIDGKDLLQLTKLHRDDTGPTAQTFVAHGRAFFRASANLGENPAGICQIFSIDKFGGGLRQITHLPWDGRPAVLGAGCFNNYFNEACGVRGFDIMADEVTGTVLFMANCDPTGRNPSGIQIFAVGHDGTGQRQLTATRGMTIDPDGTVHVEMPGPYAYQAAKGE